MQVHATTNKVLFTKPTVHGWDVVTVPSNSNPDVKYTVDMTHGRCSCPAWKFQRGGRKPCKHLRALGFTEVYSDIPAIKEPVKTNLVPAEGQYNYEENL